MAQAVAGAAALLAVDIAETVLIQIVGQLVSATLSSALAPEFLELQQLSFKLTNTRALDPSLSISAYVRGHRSADASKDDVGAYGYDAELWQAMADAAGNPLPAEVLLQAFRRGFIPKAGLGSDSVSLEQGVRESDLKNKWLPVLERLQFLLPDPGTVTEARLRGYIAPTDFLDWMRKLGYDEQVAGFIFKAAGVPISPQEGYTAFHRGLIPKEDPNPDVPSLAQIFRESRINDKYLDVWLALQPYLPPPRTVTALLRAGSITVERARELFKFAGLPEDLAQAYIDNASHQKTQATKELAVGTVVNMYKAKELTRQQAEAFIVGRGYTAEDAAFLLDYADFQLVEAQVAALVSRVRTYYVGHKIPKQTAADALANVGMATEVINHLFAIWDQEAAASPVLLTPAQIANAAAKGWISAAAGWDELQGRGYDARDAFLFLLEHKVDVGGLAVPAGVTVTP